MKLQPALVPEDLGINIDEDSPDLTDDEVSTAVATSSMDDFVKQASDFVKEVGGKPHYDRRIKAGILYCRILVEGQQRVFRTDWLRSTR